MTTGIVRSHVKAFVGDLDAFEMTSEQRHAIDRGNAEILFPRLAV